MEAELNGANNNSKARSMLEEFIEGKILQKNKEVLNKLECDVEEEEKKEVKE